MLLAVFSTSFLCNFLLIKFSQKYKLFQPKKDELSQIETRKFLPTMGGIGIFLAVNIMFLKNPAILLLANFFAAIGLVDDFLKLKKKKQNGLHMKYRLFFEIFASVIFVLYCFWLNPARNFIPFFPAISGLFFLNIFWGVFMIVGSANAVNLTDGIDSLAGTTSIFCFVFLAILAGDGLSKIFIAAISGFLIFNWPKAKIIMGDIGALGLGAAIGASFYVYKLDWYLPLIGIIFVLETFSVILQIFWIRVLKKRLFLLAPFHHHLEKKGWQKKTILIFFNFIAILALILALYIAKMKG